MYFIYFFYVCCSEYLPNYTFTYPKHSANSLVIFSFLTVTVDPGADVYAAKKHFHYARIRAQPMYPQKRSEMTMVKRYLSLPAVIGMAGMAAAGGAAPLPCLAYDVSPSVYISEIHYDNSGTDTGEKVEITGPAGTDLEGWHIVLYNGSNGASYGTAYFSGTLDVDGESLGVAAVAYSGIQNGSPDGLALVDPDGTVIQFLSYEGTFEATDGPASDMTSTDIGVFEASDTQAGYSLQLMVTDSGATWQDPQPHTFPIDEEDPAECGENYLPIYDIQGSEATSSYAGRSVVTQGVVVGDFQGSKAGFFIQDINGDDDPATSDGIFVYSTSTDVQEGDLVQVEGTVQEYYDLTEIGNVTSIAVCSSDNEMALTELLLPSNLKMSWKPMRA